MKSTAPLTADLVELAAGTAVDAAALVGAAVGWLLVVDAGFIVGGAVDGLVGAELDWLAADWLVGAAGLDEQAASKAAALPLNANAKSERRLIERKDRSYSRA